MSEDEKKADEAPEEEVVEEEAPEEPEAAPETPPEVPEETPSEDTPEESTEVSDEPEPEPEPEPVIETKPVVHVPPDLLLFGKWDPTEVEIKDPGLVRYISLKPTLIPHTAGRHSKHAFHKSKVPIVERFVNKLMNAGKRKDKRHRTGHSAGKKTRAIGVLKRAFEMIDYRTGMNPVQVLVTAIEHTAPAEETTRISYGGMAYPRSVDVAPQRRIDLALRYLSVGAVRAAHKSPKSVEECIVDELLLAYKGDAGSYAIARKEERERVARSAR